MALVDQTMSVDPEPHYGAHPRELVLDGLVATDDPTDGLAAAVRVVVKAAGRGVYPPGRQGAARRTRYHRLQLLKVMYGLLKLGLFIKKMYDIFI